MLLVIEATRTPLNGRAKANTELEIFKVAPWQFINMNKLKKEQFRNIDFTSPKEEREGFENCEFINCAFPDLSKLNILDCDFRNCNLSNLKTNASLLQTVSFYDCKLLGLNFSGSKDFGFEVHFENCNLDYASFDKKKMNKSSFKNCKMHSVNFTQADLSKCTVSKCDFFEALFNGTDLRTVDFTTCSNFIIDPELNKIQKAKFSLHSLPNLLLSYNITVENL